MNKQINLDKI